jgi:hypothetical protein
MQAGEAGSPIPELLVLPGGNQEPAVLRRRNLAQGGSLSPPVDEDGRRVGLSLGASATGLPAAAGELAQAALKERLVAAEGLEDAGEFRHEVMEALPVGARVVDGLHHGVAYRKR